MGSKCSSLAHSITYRYQRPLPALDWIFLGTWIAMVAAASLATMPKGGPNWLLPIVATLLLIVFFLRRRTTSLEIRKTSFTCEVLPGKREAIAFASIMELRESELELYILHRTISSCAATHLPKQPFSSEHWRRIVHTVAERASNYSPEAIIGIHSGT
jgi:hypothetical protein